MKRRVLSFVLVLMLCLGLAAPALAYEVPGAVSDFCTQEEWDVLVLVNQERLAAGLEPLSIFPTLQRAADIREEELGSFYSHDRPNGTSCDTVLNDVQLSLSVFGENIASGQRTPEEVMSDWMNSTGHRANILDSREVHLGVGYNGSKGMYGTSWVQLFLNSRCRIKSIAPSQDSVVCPQGARVEDLGVYLVAECSVHGACYLPLMSEMCPEFDSSVPGTYRVTVNAYSGVTTEIQVKVTEKLTFTDVPDYFAESVSWAVGQGITVGTGDGLFGSEDTCSQAHILTFLWRAKGEPEPGIPNPYQGLDEKEYYAKPAIWAYEQGIFTSATFDPDAPCTRGEVVTYLWKLAGRPTGYASGGFADVPAELADAVNWAAAQGITLGIGGGLFGTNDPCTRGEIVTFLYRAYK